MNKEQAVKLLEQALQVLAATKQNIFSFQELHALGQAVGALKEEPKKEEQS